MKSRRHWIAIAAAGVVLMLWIVSLAVCVQYRPGYIFMAGDGYVSLLVPTSESTSIYAGWHHWNSHIPWVDRLGFDRPNFREIDEGYHRLDLPFWLLLMLALVPSAARLKNHPSTFSEGQRLALRCLAGALSASLLGMGLGLLPYAPGWLQIVRAVCVLTVSAALVLLCCRGVDHTFDVLAVAFCSSLASAAVSIASFAEYFGKTLDWRAVVTLPVGALLWMIPAALPAYLVVRRRRRTLTPVQRGGAGHAATT